MAINNRLLTEFRNLSPGDQEDHLAIMKHMQKRAEKFASIVASGRKVKVGGVGAKRPYNKKDPKWAAGAGKEAKDIIEGATEAPSGE